MSVLLWFAPSQHSISNNVTTARRLHRKDRSAPPFRFSGVSDLVTRPRPPTPCHWTRTSSSHSLTSIHTRRYLHISGAIRMLRPRPVTPLPPATTNRKTSACTHHRVCRSTLVFLPSILNRLSRTRASSVQGRGGAARFRTKLSEPHRPLPRRPSRPPFTRLRPALLPRHSMLLHTSDSCAVAPDNRARPIRARGSLPRHRRARRTVAKANAAGQDPSSPRLRRLSNLA